MQTREPAIIVGVDQSCQSSAALLWAAAEARRRDVVLRIVHAWQQPEAGPLPAQRSAPSLDQDVLAEQEDIFDRVTAILERVAPDLVVTVEPVEGSPGPVLVDTASEGDLLVVGTAESVGNERLRYGPVSRHCVAHATCDVVVVSDP